MRHAIAKVTGAGNDRVIVTERGVTFGYHNLVVDMRAFPILRKLGYPVIYDVTHSLQLPGAGDGVTAGQAEFIEPLALGRRGGWDRRSIHGSARASRTGEERRAKRAAALAARAAAGTAGSDPRHRVRGDGMTDTMTGLELARKVLRIEAAAILGLVDRINGDFERAVQLLFECRGRVIVTGMGKSGLICRKIAATLSSTGTSAWFLHPAEAIHGDLGAIRDDDLVLAVSYSGETDELIRLLESIRRIGARLIAIYRRPVVDTRARGGCDASIAGSPKKRVPMNLVPTASTTAALAMGDALAMTLLVRKGISRGTVRVASPGREAGPPVDAGRTRHARGRRGACRADDDARWPMCFTRCRASASA